MDVNGKSGEMGEGGRGSGGKWVRGGRDVCF